MKSAVKYIALALPLLLLTACSSTPSASDAESVLRHKISKQSEGLIELVKFTKKNSQDAEVMGVKLHSIEFEAEIRFLEKCYWGSPLEQSFEVQRGEPGPFNMWMYMGKRKAEKGQRETITGTLRFEKTEKGWRGEDGEIY